MKIGKLPENILKRSVLEEIKNHSENVIIGAGVGEDCAVFSLEHLSGKEDCRIAVTTNVVTEQVPNFAQLAIYTAANNLACGGATMVSAQVAILLPGTTKEEELKKIMRQFETACQELGVQITGGHTEITRSVKEPVLTVTGIGYRRKKDLFEEQQILCNNREDRENKIQKGAEISPIQTEGRQRPTHQDVIVTKWVGLEGSYTLAVKKEKQLKQRFPDYIIDEAKAFDRYLSIVPEAATAIKSDVSLLHDLSKGGILGGLWEMAEKAGVGLDIDLKKIPIRQETVEICNYLDVNPYELMSTGSLLIVTKDGEALLEKLWAQDIPAVIIGKTTSEKARTLTVDYEQRYLTRPGSDEIRKAFEESQAEKKN